MEYLDDTADRDEKEGPKIYKIQIEDLKKELDRMYKDNENLKSDLHRMRNDNENLKSDLDVYKKSHDDYAFYKLIVASVISIALVGAVIGYAIPKHYELEQEKLELARYQFEVQADQKNKSLKLQEANETTKLFEILMNSRLLETAASELLGAQKEVSNAAKDLAMELIKTLKVNVNCTPRWLCESKDQKSEQIVTNSSATERHSQNMPANSLWTGNNNKENICFACRYMNLDTR